MILSQITFLARWRGDFASAFRAGYDDAFDMSGLGSSEYGAPWEEPMSSIHTIMAKLFGQDPKPGSTVICVLGMHRSGTSCLAGCLQEAGLELGDVVERAPHNPKGNRENLAIRSLNDDVLAYSNGAWDQPPENLRWTRGHRRRRDEIISGYAEFSPWGFKDPRTVLTLPFCGEVLPHLLFAGTFRHPMAVAGSLAWRDGLGAIRRWRCGSPIIRPFSPFTAKDRFQSYPLISDLINIGRPSSA